MGLAYQDSCRSRVETNQQRLAGKIHGQLFASDPGPRVEPCAQCRERPVAGGHGAGSEADCYREELATLAGHAPLQSYVGRCAEFDECSTFGLCGAFETSPARPEVIGTARLGADGVNQVQAIP